MILGLLSPPLRARNSPAAGGIDPRYKDFCDYLKNAGAKQGLDCSRPEAPGFQEAYARWLQRQAQRPQRARTDAGSLKQRKNIDASIDTLGTIKDPGQFSRFLGENRGAGTNVLYPAGSAPRGLGRRNDGAATWTPERYARINDQLRRQNALPGGRLDLDVPPVGSTPHKPLPGGGLPPAIPIAAGSLALAAGAIVRRLAGRDWKPSGSGGLKTVALIGMLALGTVALAYGGWLLIGAAEMAPPIALAGGGAAGAGGALSLNSAVAIEGAITATAGGAGIKLAGDALRGAKSRDSDGSASDEEAIKFSKSKGATKWQNQMRQRGWTEREIREALARGRRFQAQNNIHPDHGATRFEINGKSVVTDNVTHEVIHIGGDGFQY